MYSILFCAPGFCAAVPHFTFPFKDVHQGQCGLSVAALGNSGSAIFCSTFLSSGFLGMPASPTSEFIILVFSFYNKKRRGSTSSLLSRLPWWGFPEPSPIETIRTLNIIVENIERQHVARNSIALRTTHI